MAYNLSYEKIIEYRTAFEFSDKDKSESITIKIRDLGKNLSDNQLKEMVLEVDSDGSGTIYFKSLSGWL